jgi:energy-converting hydrogenase Eha subunit B
MALESATYINQLVPANPVHTDPLSQGDSHLRLIKSTLQATFPAVTGPVTPSQADLNTLVGAATTAPTSSGPVISITPAVGATPGHLYIGGDHTVYGNQTVVTNQTINGTQTVAGYSQFNVNIQVNGDTVLLGQLSVGKDLTVSGPTGINVPSGGLTVSGSNGINVPSGGLTVGGTTYANGNLQVGGSTSLAGDLTINGHYGINVVNGGIYAAQSIHAHTTITADGAYTGGTGQLVPSNAIFLSAGSVIPPGYFDVSAYVSPLPTPTGFRWIQKL